MRISCISNSCLSQRGEDHKEKGTPRNKNKLRGNEKEEQEEEQEKRGGKGGEEGRKKPRMNPPDKYSSLTDDVRTSPPPLPAYEYTDIISGIDSLRGRESVRPDNDDIPSSLMTHGTRNTYPR